MTSVSASRAITTAGVDLLKHAERHYTDYQVAHDMDCLLREARTEGERRLLRGYARLRRVAPNYRPAAMPSRSNHDWISPAALDSLHRMTALEPDEPSPSNVCAVCGTAFSARRDARTCSPRCRKALSRHTYPPKLAVVGSGTGTGKNEAVSAVEHSTDRDNAA